MKSTKNILLLSIKYCVCTLPPGLEPGTYRLTGERSDNSTTETLYSNTQKKKLYYKNIYVGLVGRAPYLPSTRSGFDSRIDFKFNFYYNIINIYGRLTV